MHIFLILLAISVLCLIALGFTDPKRNKSRAYETSRNRFSRYGLVLLSLLPGIWMLFVQEGSYFLIWLGVLTIAGWLVALSLQKLN